MFNVYNEAIEIGKNKCGIKFHADAKPYVQLKMWKRRVRVCIGQVCEKLLLTQTLEIFKSK